MKSLNMRLSTMLKVIVAVSRYGKGVHISRVRFLPISSWLSRLRYLHMPATNKPDLTRDEPRRGRS
jgi:hypothetical protein